MTQYTIYALACVNEQRAYIGCTTNLSRRIEDHLSNLHRGVHHNKELQAAYDKYSLPAFRVVIRDTIDDYGEARLEEADQIRELGRKAYNVAHKARPAKPVRSTKRVRTTDPTPPFDIHQIAELVRRGLSDQEVSLELDILPIMVATVRNHPLRSYL